ncbi:MAG: hypothetical protein DMG57_05525 [Acidobacteria bacterium]|nr:MAG: hypothetical protein DMG57_05525 [Acidobacteriota bacterium]
MAFRGVATDRKADGPTGPGALESAQPTPRRGSTAGGSTGFGVDSAHQIIAEVGASAATFPSEKHLSSWVGVWPGEEESAGVSESNRSPKGNRQMRRVLN